MCFRPTALVFNKTHAGDLYCACYHRLVFARPLLPLQRKCVISIEPHCSLEHCVSHFVLSLKPLLTAQMLSHFVHTVDNDYDDALRDKTHLYTENHAQCNIVIVNSIFDWRKLKQIITSQLVQYIEISHCCSVIIR